jgi:hypothetical protein
MTRIKPTDPKRSPEEPEPVDDPETEKSDDGEAVDDGLVDEHALRHGLEIDDEFEPTLDVPHPPIVKRPRAFTR